MRSLRGSNAAAVIAELNPIVKGWAAYYRGAVSKKTFSSLDDYLWELAYKWAVYSHANKPKRWVVARYFGKFNKFRNNHWVFGDAASGAHLARFAWTAIVRHIMVKGGASPDDPALSRYWAERRQKIKPPVDGYTLRLLARQDSRCPLCGLALLAVDQPPESPHEWERWWLLVIRKAITVDFLVHHGRPDSPDGDQTRLVHASCQSELRTRQRRTAALRI
jgi:RNA-directed DNA polymerase